MRGEDLIRETLARAADAEPAAGDAFARFQSRERSAVRLRNLVVAGGALAAMLTLFFTLPGIGGSGPPGVMGDRSGDEKPQARLLKRYTDELVGWEIQYPAEWGGRARPSGSAYFFQRFEGEEEEWAVFTRTAGANPAVESPTRLFIHVRALDVSCRERQPGRPIRCERDRDIRQELEAQAAAGGVDVTRSTAEIDGRPARVYIMDYTTERPVNMDAAPTSWCAYCYVVHYFVSWPDEWMLSVRVVAPDPETYERYKEDIDRTLASLTLGGPAHPR